MYICNTGSSKLTYPTPKVLFEIFFIKCLPTLPNPKMVPRPHQDQIESLGKVNHPGHVIYEKTRNFMVILMAGLVNPDFDRHISKKNQKLKKKLGEKN